MSVFVNRRDIQGLSMPGHISYPMLDVAHGCVAGFKSGITVYTATEYPSTGVHEDQEGFVVMEGTGWAKVGDEEQRLEPDVCFIAPAGVAHCIKRDKDSPHLKVCWFHGAIR
jgi:mannose-6-phosphate isomerase-like protein (cupin superfamily)